MISRILKIAALCGVFIAITAVSAYFTLSLVIKSEDTVVVPDFIGKDVVTVLEYLTDIGLNTKVKGSEYSGEIPKNHVIFQEPKPGSEIKKGRDVKIVLSKGAQTIEMPNLIGLSAREVKIVLEENDLCNGVTSWVYDPDNESDRIIAQVPLSGDEIKRGECVNILVSRGARPKAYIMPELTGLPLDQALVTIEKYRLRHGKITVETQKGEPIRRVLRQVPGAGHRILEQSDVDLVINQQRTGNGSGNLLGETGSGIFRYRVDNGLLKRNIRVQWISNGITTDLFDEFVKPGREIWLIIPVEREATVLLYEDDKLVRTEVFQSWQ